MFPTVAGNLVDCLLDHRVRHLFTLSGNQILSLYDATIGRDLELIHTRHEAAAVHMADAWGRLQETPGVAVVTAGPGHCNAIGALYVALQAESPLVLISGHSPLSQSGKGAFQEMDQVAIAAPVTKASWRVDAPERAGAILDQALKLAGSGRPGPVHLSVPSDVLAAEVESQVNVSPQPDPAEFLREEEAGQVLRLLAGARRPLILAGAAMSRPLRWRSIMELASACGAPPLKMESPRGVNDPRLYGASRLLGRADLVLLLGKELDFALRFGGSPFAADSRFVSIDSHESRAPAHPRMVLSLRADPAAAASELARRSQTDGASFDSWRRAVESARSETPAEWEHWRRAMRSPIHPLRVCEGLRPFLADGAVVVSDGGEFGQWAQAGLDSRVNLINGPSGAIGSAIPMALACKLARPGKPVFALLGDGTFGYHALEFDTALRYGLPIVAVVGNDARWNAEYQLQLDHYGRDRAVACELLPSRYDQVVEALGGHGEWVSDPEQLESALQRALESGRPACVNVAIEGAKAPTF